MSTVADYVGRTVDVVAYQGSVIGKDTLLTQSLGNTHGVGQVNTGIVKLGQRFMLELLTEVGSMPFLPLRGCSFMTEARLGYFRNQLSVLSAFSRALLGLARNLRNEESSDDADDERYGIAVVSNIEYTAGEVKIYVTLISRAGNATAILPISVVI